MADLLLKSLNRDSRMKSIKEALSLILGQTRKPEPELVGIDEAYNRTLAADILADRDYPPFNRAMMDGFALNTDDWNTSQIRRFKVIEELHAGAVPKHRIGKGDCLKIMTGAAAPLEADVVIPVELSKQQGSFVTFDEKENLVKWRNIALQGEDRKAGEVLAKKGQICDAGVISVLAVTGKSKVQVVKLPTVSVISTGTELLRVEREVLPHQIRDSNSYALQSLLKKYSIGLQHKLLVPDDKQQLKTAIEKGLQSEVLILSGGVSMGDADFVPEILKILGVKTIFHKVMIKPGKPLWFGKNETGTLVFGLPGNPMSCQVGFKIFVEPALRAMMGLSPASVLYLPMIGGHKKRSPFAEYFPARIVNKDGHTFIQQNPYNGSGDIAAMIGSDGLAVHPAGVKELEADTIVEFLAW